MRLTTIVPAVWNWVFNRKRSSDELNYEALYASSPRSIRFGVITTAEQIKDNFLIGAGYSFSKSVFCRETTRLLPSRVAATGKGALLARTRSLAIRYSSESAQFLSRP